jgi:hypothetical protein
MLLGGELAVYDHSLKSALRIRYGYADDTPRDRAKVGRVSTGIPRDPRPGNPGRDLQISQATWGGGALKAAGLSLAVLSLAPKTPALRVDL